MSDKITKVLDEREHKLHKCWGREVDFITGFLREVVERLEGETEEGESVYEHDFVAVNDAYEKAGEVIRILYAIKSELDAIVKVRTIMGVKEKENV